MLYVTVSASCGPLAYKIVDLGYFINTGQVFIFPLLYCFADVLTEIFGERAANLVIYVKLGCDFIFISLIIIMVHLPSPTNWDLQKVYNTVFNPMLYLYTGVLIGTLCNSLINIRLLGKWKILTKGKYFWLRSFGASTIGIIVYTFPAAFISYHKLINYPLNLFKFTLIRTISNIVLISFYTIFSSLLVDYLKRKLDLDTSQVTGFNPFQLARK